MLATRFRTLALSAVLCLTACLDRTNMPKEWGPLSLAKGERCPSIAGRYLDSSAPIARMLAARFLPYDSVDADWDSFELTGSADTGFEVTVRYLDGEERTGRARKGGPNGGDYYCADGWLQIGNRDFPNTWDADGVSDSYRPDQRAMRIAPGKDGALVARLDLIRYDEFTVWCGDGCKGLPIPWTWETRSTWSVAQRWDGNAPASREFGPGGEEGRQTEALERARRDLVYQAEQAQENGSPVDGREAVRSRGLAALVPGMLLREVAPRDSGWHLSLEFEEMPQLRTFLVRLSQSGPVAELREAPHYRARSTNGRWRGVVYVRFEPGR